MERKEQAEVLAEAFATSFLHDKYGHDLFIGGQIEHILAEYANVIYQYVEDEEFFGVAVTHENEEQFIALNTYHPLRTRYFTASHELWHLTKYKDLDNEFFDHERAADRFAAAIMLPKALIKDLWNKLSELNDIESCIIHLSDFAQVPYLAMVRRVKELGYTIPSSLANRTEHEWRDSRIELGFPYSNLDEPVKETRFKAYEDVVKQNVEHIGLDTLIAANKLAKFAPKQAEQYQKTLYLGENDEET
ncbi:MULTISPECIES: ImmA/IrrE family metallo-endopeptidase [unclassified Lysinibacillus]|uniref:ImmA/IrrE family metallo-endopeptidase n=1 Tax=unclassified Lysinibacillus TaxID=2636778 RepID=UPI00255241EE|nr:MULTISPECIES: ImmA/IrrE family metallo-endopeptidase [unclassified Lysinibacillus]MDM5246123.1 ImmA/IrrE family metallo-endopeptidase [Lysinibacillus sp. G4S2]